jgi:hypothetical protein
MTLEETRSDGESTGRITSVPEDGVIFCEGDDAEDFSPTQPEKAHRAMMRMRLRNNKEIP